MTSGIRLTAFIGGILCLVWLLNRALTEQEANPPEQVQMAIKVQPVPVEPVHSEPSVEPEPVHEPESMVEPESVVSEALTADHPVPDQLPSISAAYQNSIGFSQYVTAMQALGGRFFIYDDTRNKLLDAFSPLSGKTHTIQPSNLAGLSPRLRELSYESSVEPVLSRYRDRHSQSRIKWVLLLPVTVEAQINAQLSQAFQSGVLPPGEWVRAEAEYQMLGERLVLKLLQLRGRSGVESVDHTVHL